MDNDHEVRRYAAEAQEMADRSWTDADRASWLRIAQSWLKMLSPQSGSAEDRFEDDAKVKGTGQEPSEDSH